MRVNKNAFDKFHTVKQGQKAIDDIGHRRYVGGVGKNWHEIGMLQFKFLVNHGLRPHHVLLDIACGSLRAGIHFVPYLDTGRYLGLDKEPSLIKAGLEIELGNALTELKKPELVISDSFEFHKLSKNPDYALAQSLFTHLPPEMIHDCFKKLAKVMRKGGKFYATFFESKNKIKNPSKPHDRLGYWFTKKDIIEFGKNNGWSVNHIGDWGHPRNQIIVEYTCLG